MITFTSTLPDDVFLKLGEVSKRFSLPKNKIIERALSIYLEQLNKAEYIKSYKRAADDEDVFSIAEEGMEDYFQQLNG